jgi:hypothetical protein
LVSVLSAVLMVGATPAYASDDRACSLTSDAMSLRETSIGFGQETVLSWRVTAPSGCEMTVRIGTLYEGPLMTGSMVVNNAMYGFGPNAWAMTVWVTSIPEKRWNLSTVTLNVTPPTPDADGSQVFIQDASLASRQRFVTGVMARNAVVRIAGDVNLDLSYLSDIPVGAGTQILGDRTVVGIGPRLFTRSFPRRLLTIGFWDGSTADNVRISGIRFDGQEPSDPCESADTATDSDAVTVFASAGVEIDRNEFYKWRGSAVNIHDDDGVTDRTPTNRLTKDNPQAVWIHDNSFHDNQHPTTCDLLSSSGHGAGYGVNVGDGAYALIERNVFDKNRHAVASNGKGGSGYYLYRNLFLAPGVDSVHWPITSFNHQIDVHGLSTCGSGEHYNCGPAGEYMDVAYNTVGSAASDAIQLRGVPTDSRGMSVHDNVFAQNRENALTQTQTGLRDNGGNTFTKPLFSYHRGTCDFDGDGSADLFIATGVTWWYDSSRYGRWTFLNQSADEGDDIVLADRDGDGRCDATSPGGEVHLGPEGVVWDNHNAYGSPIAVAGYPGGGVEIIGTDGADGVFRRTRNSAGAINDWGQFDGAKRSVAAETYADGRVDLFAVDAFDSIYHRVQTSTNNFAGSSWQQLDGQLRSIALTRYPDGKMELVGVNRYGNVWRRIQATAGTWNGSVWQQLDGDMRQVAVETTVDGRADLFAVNAEGAIYHRRQVTAGSWAGSAWARISGELSSIAVARNGTGALEVFGANRYGSVWHMTQTSIGNWGGATWQPFDGRYSQIAADTTTNGRIEVVAVDARGVPASRTQPAAGSWTGTSWTALGGQLRPTRPVFARLPMALSGGDTTNVVGDPVNSQVVSANNGTGPFFWSVVGLPPGLTMDPNSGMVTGMVTTKGTYQVSTTVIDSSNPPRSLTVNYTWTVYSASCWGRLTDHRAVVIPDLGTVNSNHPNGCLGNASAQSSIAVDITHTYVGDLVIDLVAPSGRVYNLFNRTGGAADNLVATFNVNLSAEPLEGIWTVRIRDVAGGDSGQLNLVTLKVQ